MPVMSGVDAMEAFREFVHDNDTNNSSRSTYSRQDRERNKDMLIVGFSANASDKDLEQAFQGGTQITTT